MPALCRLVRAPPSLVFPGQLGACEENRGQEEASVAGRKREPKARWLALRTQRGSAWQIENREITMACCKDSEILMELLLENQVDVAEVR